jgi:hypothetical protein
MRRGEISTHPRHLGSLPWKQQNDVAHARSE